MKRTKKKLKNRNLLCLFCGITFNMKQEEIKRYKQKGYRSPTLCPACRILRRQDAEKRRRRIEKFVG